MCRRKRTRAPSRLEIKNKSRKWLLSIRRTRRVLQARLPCSTKADSNSAPTIYTDGPIALLAVTRAVTDSEDRTSCIRKNKVQLFNNSEPTFRDQLEISAKRTTAGEGEDGANVPVFTTIYPPSPMNRCNCKIQMQEQQLERIRQVTAKTIIGKET